MVRRATIVVFLVVASACSGDGLIPTSTTPPPTATTSSVPREPPRAGMVVAPDLILAAGASGVLTPRERDVQLTMAAFVGPEIIPFEYLRTASEASPAQWDHSATTRLIQQWDELSGETQVEVINAIDGFDELVGRPGFGGTPSQGPDGCIPVVTVAASVCIGESISQVPAPGLLLDEAVVVVQPWVRDAAEDAWTAFVRLFGAAPESVKVFLSNLAAPGGYSYLPGSESEAGSCHIYVDVLNPAETDPDVVAVGDETVPDGVPLQSQIQAEVAHQMFHCFQRQVLSSFSAPLWEGSATWSEHYVYPTRNTELRWMRAWVADPRRPFEDRLQDASFGFLFADRRGAGAQAVVDALVANSIFSLDSEFEDMWHAISVAAWNRPPVEVLHGDGGTSIPGEVDDLEASEISPETAGAMDFMIPLYSRDVRAFEFLVDEPGAAGFSRLRLDLSGVPDDVRITAIPETEAGWLEPVALSGAEWQFCRMAIGACAGVDPEAVHPFTRIVLVVTNVDNGMETFSIPWNTFNPHLHGTWVRTDGPLLTDPGATAPYGIVGTELGFDEEQGLMIEATEGYSLTNVEPGWECTFGGAYSVGAVFDYDAPAGGNVSGTVAIEGESEGDDFTNTCVFTASNGGTTSGRGLHIPLAADPMFGFEIRSYDTIWVYATGRIFVYERVGE